MRSGDLGIEMLDGDLGGCKWKKRKGWEIFGFLVWMDVSDLSNV